MKTRRVLQPLCALLGAFSVLYGQATMSNADLIKLTKSGLSEDFIINLVDQQGSRLSSDISALIEMK